MISIFKYSVIYPVVALSFIIFVAVFENDAMGKEYVTKTNVIHDFLGAKILTDNNVEYTKIVSTKKKDVAFCDDKRNLYVYFDETKKVLLKGKDSNKCGKTLTQDGVKEGNGLGQAFGTIIKMFNSEDDKSDPQDGPSTVEKDAENE